MSVKMRSDDYALQLTKINVSPKREHLMTFYEMTNRMEHLYSSLKNTTWIPDEIERQERRIKLKIAYMMMTRAYKEIYGIDARTGYDDMVEKQPLLAKIRDLENEADNRARVILAENPRKTNEYDVLKIPKRTPTEEIGPAYKNILAIFEAEVDEKMDSEKYEETDVIQYSTLMSILENSYKSLRDPVYKMKLDNTLILNFNPNQASRYVPNNFADITYIPGKKYVQGLDGSTQLPTFIAKSSNGDETIVVETGDVGFGRFRQPNGSITFENPYALKEYRIIKKYADPTVLDARRKLADTPESNVEWDEVEGGEVFIVYGNIDTRLLTRPETDKEYIRYNNDVLLSTANIEAAITYNGGYIGEIGVDLETREYVVQYDHDRLCLAKEFQKIKHSRLERGKPIMGVPYRTSLDNRRDSDGGER